MACSNFPEWMDKFHLVHGGIFSPIEEVSILKSKTNKMKELLEQRDECVNGFVLPERWCVKVTNENVKTLDGWKKKTGFCGDAGDYSYIKYNGAGAHEASLTEITFEKFQEHVLNKKEMKTPVGYRLKDDCQNYKTAVKRICWPVDFYGQTFNTECDLYKKLKEAQVLGLWFEPVYTKENVVLPFGGKSVTLMFDRGMAYCNKYAFSFDNIVQIKREIPDTKIGVFRVSYPTIKIGCTTGTMEEFDAIVNAIEQEK